VGEEEPILDEVMDNLKEAAQRIRATQSRLRASGLVEQPNCAEPFLPLERGACNDGGGVRRGQAQGGAGQELAAILAGCIEGITLNTAAYGREAAYSEPRLKTLDGRAKVPKQLRMDHKQCLPQLR
jgi:hypothetical protein